MRAWAFMLSGLVVWALHFLGVYTIASVFDLVSRAEAPAARWAIAGFTLVCLAADLGVLAAAVGRTRPPADDVSAWIRSLAGLGALISLVAVAWQGLPAIVGV